jgi:TusA-related sulfurtransferase
MELDFKTFTADQMFDGGDLDCGSGLILLIRESMLDVPVGGILEMRSREPSVSDDLPPWCRMSGHEYLGKKAGNGYTRYFVRKGSGTRQEKEDNFFSTPTAVSVVLPAAR